VTEMEVGPCAPSRFLHLPAELIDHICFFLTPTDLDAFAATSRTLRSHATKDLAWHHHVQDNVPGCVIKSPYPYATYRELYFSHDPHWFLTKYKIWFCDYHFTGKIMIVRFDPRRGCIEGYRLVAERKMPEFAHWEADDEVIIHSFEPKVQLHMDLPVLQLDALLLEQLTYDKEGAQRRKFDMETPMHVHNRSGTFSNFLLARRVVEHSRMALWPPGNIPARHRVRNSSQEGFIGTGHKPQKRSEISDQAFRIRRWMRMAGPMLNTHIQGQVDTYATLDPKLYTPTADKPYRGIWVGDYSGHGCEFLLIHQPDDQAPAEAIQRDDESVDEYLARKREERIHRGRLEAIKLTGDPNIPRGEFTFVAEDLGDGGFVRIADEARFKGARIVKSKGQIAERNFRNSSSTPHHHHTLIPRSS